MVIRHRLALIVFGIIAFSALVWTFIMARPGSWIGKAMAEDAVQIDVAELHPPFGINIRSASLTPISARLGPTLTSAAQRALKIKMVVSSSGPPPRWWGNQGVSLTGFSMIDKKGQVTSIRRDYFGTSTPEQPERLACAIEYTLPERVARKDLAAIKCTLATSNGSGKDIPLANLTIR